MKTLLGLVLFTLLMASCMSSNHSYDSRGRTQDASVRKWKPVKDRTPYYKLVKVAERD